MKTFASRAATGAIALMLMGAGLPMNSDDNEMTVPALHEQLQYPLPIVVVALPDSDGRKATVLGSEGRSLIEAKILGGPDVNGVVLVGAVTIMLGAGALACIAARRRGFT